jgi:hypothetical protein
LKYLTNLKIKLRFKIEFSGGYAPILLSFKLNRKVINIMEITMGYCLVRNDDLMYIQLRPNNGFIWGYGKYPCDAIFFPSEKLALEFHKTYINIDEVKVVRISFYLPR